MSNGTAAISMASGLDDRRFGHFSAQLPHSDRAPRHPAEAVRSNSHPEAVHRELQSAAAPDPSNGFLPKARIGWKFDHHQKSSPRSDTSILANERWMDSAFAAIVPA